MKPIRAPVPGEGDFCSWIPPNPPHLPQLQRAAVPRFTGNSPHWGAHACCKSIRAEAQLRRSALAAKRLAVCVLSEEEGHARINPKADMVSIGRMLLPRQWQPWRLNASQYAP